MCPPSATRKGLNGAFFISAAHLNAINSYELRPRGRRMGQSIALAPQPQRCIHLRRAQRRLLRLDFLRLILTTNCVAINLPIMRWGEFFAAMLASRDGFHWEIHSSEPAKFYQFCPVLWAFCRFCEAPISTPLQSGFGKPLSHLTKPALTLSDTYPTSKLPR